ncbi:MAG: hypothetical protein IKK70_06930 [Clostridia bacterium]|nr:hypothetical protein [Clostridia bacterium]
MKKYGKTAFAGIFTALCFIFLFIGSLFQTLDLSAAALGSIVILIAYVELGTAYSLGVYLSASILSFLLLPYKSAAIVFAFFAGFYPVLKVTLNKIKPLPLSYAVRILCFNVFLTLAILAATFIFHVEAEYLVFEIILYLLCNVTFVVYDLALERVAVYYVNKIRPKLFK